MHRLEVQGLMLNMHPDISTTIKRLTQRRSGDLVEQTDKDHFWRYMTETFNASFFIDTSFKYVQPSGGIVMGCTVLMADVHFPENIVCVNNFEAPCPFLSSHHPHFSKHRIMSN